MSSTPIGLAARGFTAKMGMTSTNVSTSRAVQPSFSDLGTPLSEVTFVVVDLETTGTRAGDAAITEIGAVKVRGGEVLGEFQSLVNAGRPVPAFIARLTGITSAMVADAPEIQLVLPSFLEWARGGVLVAHNAPFDIGFLKAACAELDYPWPGFTVVDTVPLARRVITRDEVRNHKLSTLAELFRAEVTPEHRALADARATVDVLHGILGRLGSMGVTHLEDLATAADPVPPEIRRKRSLADDLPEAPGVYLFRGPNDEVLYVGTSTNIRKRVRSYFTAAEKRQRITEMVRIAHAVTPVVCATPLEAAVRELRLIVEHAPRYNRRSKHPERYSWVRLTEEAYPRLSIVHEVRSAVPHIGPYPSARAAREAVDALHDALALRQCVARLPAVSKAAGSPCALAGMARCCAPCLAVADPKSEYATVVSAAEHALACDPAPVVRALGARIANLAAAERFEEAGLVTSRLRTFLQGAARAQQLFPLASCAELIAARPVGEPPNSSWEIVVVRYGRLAGTAVSAPNSDPLAVVAAVQATAETVEPTIPPAPACHPEEAALILHWLDQPGVRIVSTTQPWSLPVNSALAHSTLADVSGEIRQRLDLDTPRMAAC